MIKDYIKKSAKITGLVLLGFIGSLIYLGVSVLIFGQESVKFFSNNPFVSGFLHGGLEHIGFNLLAIFLLLLPLVNSKYNFEKIFWITFFISLIYLPLSIFGIMPYAIGISGTCCFLASRYFLTWEKHKNIGIALLAIIAIPDLLNLFDSGAKIAHGVHLIGYILGVISLKKDLLRKITPNWIYDKIGVE